MLYHTLIILYRYWSPTGGLPVAYRLSTEVGIGISPVIILYSHWSPTGGLPVAYQWLTDSTLRSASASASGLVLQIGRTELSCIFYNKFELYIVQQMNSSFLLGYELLHFCHATFKRSQALFRPFLQIR